MTRWTNINLHIHHLKYVSLSLCYWEESFHLYYVVFIDRGRPLSKE